MNKIENYLNTTDKRQKYLIFLMIFGLIGYLFVQIIMPMREEQLSLQDEIIQLQTKLVNNSLSRLKNQREAKKRELLKLKSEKQKKKEKNEYLISGLYKLKYAFYDEKEWAKSIDDILKYSLKRDLKIEYIKSLDSKDEKNSDILKKKGSFEISGGGNYIDIVAFISYIDNLNTLLQFKKIELKLGQKGLKFTLLIDMYGIGL